MNDTSRAVAQKNCPEEPEMIGQCGGCLARTRELAYIETAKSSGYACPTCREKLASIKTLECGCRTDGAIREPVCVLAEQLHSRLRQAAGTATYFGYSAQWLEHFDPAAWLSCADTAKLVRAELKAAFPSIKFRVHSSTYAGGASIDVSWIDGPTTSAVERVAKYYEGATFDGSIDLKSSKPAVRLDGRRVKFGADFVSCQRQYTTRFVQSVVDRVTADLGLEPFTVQQTNWGPDWSAADSIRLPSGDNLQDAIHRALWLVGKI